jgi:hypothetical protein
MDWQETLRRAGVIGAIVAAIAACAEAGDRETSPDTAASAGAVVDSVDPPVSYTETISIEGTAQQLAVVDYRSPADFALGFTTVVPTDMRIDYATSGRGDEIRFEAAFGGVHRPDAALSIVAFPAGTDTAAVRARIDETVAQVRGVRMERNPDDWALERYRVADGHSGSLGVGLQNGTWYFIMTLYPPEYGDGMGPRADLILRRWQWTGSGTPLWPN